METEKTETPESTKSSAHQIPADDDHDSNLHYYSGGEIRELANTQVGGFLTGFWLLLIATCIGCMAYFGGVRQFGLYRPQGGSVAGLQAAQNTLSQTDVNHGAEAVNVLDLNQVYRPAGQTVTDAISKGSDVYQSNCIGCHGPNQDGNGINAASLNPKPRNLHDAPFMQGMSYQRINTSIHKGVPGTAMPRWENTLSADQMADVIVYVFSLTTPLPTSSSPTASVPTDYKRMSLDQVTFSVASAGSHSARSENAACPIVASAS
jgi:mono/diheme cytochrome c family protein